MHDSCFGFQNCGGVTYRQSANFISILGTSIEINIIKTFIRMDVKKMFFLLSKFHFPYIFLWMVYRFYGV